MAVAHIFRLLVSKFLRAFVTNLEDVGIQWTGLGSFTLRRLSIKPSAFTHLVFGSFVPWLDLESLYIHKITFDCSWRFLWSSSEVLKVEVDTIVGLIVPYSSSVRSTFKETLRNESVYPDDWSPGPLLDLLADRDLHFPIHYRDEWKAGKKSDVSSSGWTKQVVQWGAGKMLNIASNAVSFIGEARKIFQSKQLFTEDAEAHGRLPLLLSKILSWGSRVEIIFTNCHIRYEDSRSSPRHPFQFGIAFQKLHIKGSSISIQGVPGFESFASDHDISTVMERQSTSSNPTHLGETDETRSFFPAPALQFDLDIPNFSIYHNTDCYEGIGATDFAPQSREYRKHFLKGIGCSTDRSQLHSYLFSPTLLKLQAIAAPLLFMPESTVCLKLKCQTEELELNLSQHQLRDVLSLLRCLEKFANESEQGQHTVEQEKCEEVANISTTRVAIVPLESLDHDVSSTTVSQYFCLIPCVKAVGVVLDIPTVKLNFKRLPLPSSQHSNEASLLSLQCDELKASFELRQSRDTSPSTTLGLLSSYLVFEHGNICVKKITASDAVASVLMLCLPTSQSSLYPVPWNRNKSHDTQFDVQCRRKSVSLPLSVSSSSSTSSLLSAVSETENEELFIEFEKNTYAPVADVATDIGDHPPMSSQDDSLSGIGSRQASLNSPVLDWNCFEEQPKDICVSVNLSASKEGTSAIHIRVEPIQIWIRSIRHFFHEATGVCCTDNVEELSDLMDLFQRLQFVSSNSKSTAKSILKETRMNYWSFHREPSIMHPVNCLSISFSKVYLCILDEFVEEVSRSNSSSSEDTGERNPEYQNFRSLNNEKCRPIGENVRSSKSFSKLAYTASGVCMSFESFSAILDPKQADSSRNFGCRLSGICVAVLSQCNDSNSPSPPQWIRCVAPVSVDLLLSLITSVICEKEENFPSCRHTESLPTEMFVRLGISPVAFSMSRQLKAVAQEFWNILSRVSCTTPKSRVIVSHLSDRWLASLEVSRLPLIGGGYISSFDGAQYCSFPFQHNIDAVDPLSDVLQPSTNASGVSNNLSCKIKTPTTITDGEQDSLSESSSTESEVGFNEDVFYDSVDVRDAVAADLAFASLSLERYKEQSLLDKAEEVERKPLFPIALFYGYLKTPCSRIQQLFQPVVTENTQKCISLFLELSLAQFLFVLTPNLIPNDNDNSHGLVVDITGVSTVLCASLEKDVTTEISSETLDGSIPSIDSILTPSLQQQSVWHLRAGYRMDGINVDALPVGTSKFGTASNGNRSNYQWMTTFQQNQEVNIDTNDGVNEISPLCQTTEKAPINLIDSWVESISGSNVSSPVYSVGKDRRRLPLVTASLPESRKPPNVFWGVSKDQAKLLSGDKVYVRELVDALGPFGIRQMWEGSFPGSLGDDLFHQIVPLRSFSVNSQSSHKRKDFRLIKSAIAQMIKKLKMCSLISASRENKKDAFVLTTIDVSFVNTDSSSSNGQLTNDIIASWRCWAGRLSLDVHSGVLSELLSCLELQKSTERSKESFAETDDYSTSALITTLSNAKAAENEKGVQTHNKPPLSYIFQTLMDRCGSLERSVAILSDCSIESVSLSGYPFENSLKQQQAPEVAGRSAFTNLTAHPLLVTFSELPPPSNSNDPEYLRYPVAHSSPLFTSYVEYTRVISATILRSTCLRCANGQFGRISTKTSSRDNISKRETNSLPILFNPTYGAQSLTGSFGSHGCTGSPSFAVSPTRAGQFGVASGLSVLPEHQIDDISNKTFSWQIQLACLEVAFEEASLESHLPKFLCIHDSLPMSASIHNFARVERFPVLRVAPLPPPANRPFIISLRTTNDLKNKSTVSHEPKWVPLLKYVSPGVHISSLYCALLASNLSVELPWDFFLISGYWLFQWVARIETFMKYRKRNLSTEGNCMSKTIDSEVDIKDTISSPGDFMKLTNLLVVNAAINDVSLSMSTNSTIWISSEIKSFQFSYPRQEPSRNRTTTRTVSPVLEASLCPPNPLVISSESLSEFISAGNIANGNKYLFVVAYSAKLSIWTSPLNAHPHRMKSQYRDKAIRLATAGEIRLSINLLRAVPSFPFRGSSFGWLAESKLCINITLGIHDSFELTEPVHFVPGVLVLACSNRVAQLLLLALDGFDTVIGFARIVLQTGASAASRQIKRNVKNLFLGAVCPHLILSVRMLDPVFQLLNLNHKIACVVLAEELSISCEYKADVLTHVSVKLSQARGLTSYHTVDTSCGQGPQLMQFFCLAPSCELPTKASILCQPLSMIFPLPLSENVLLLDSVASSPQSRKPNEVDSDDTAADVTLLEFTSKVSQLKSSVMLQAQTPNMQLVLFPELLPRLQQIALSIMSEVTKLNFRFSRTGRNLASISSGVSSTSSVCDSSIQFNDHTPVIKPVSVAGDVSDGPSDRTISFAEMSHNHSSNLLNPRSLRSVPNPPSFYPTGRLPRDPVSPTVAALDGHRPLGFNAAFSVGSFSTWFISRPSIDVKVSKEEDIKLSRRATKIKSNSSTTYKAVIYSSQISCKVYSENLKAKKFFSFSGNFPVDKNQSFLTVVESYLVRRPLPSLRLDMEITNGVFLVGDLDVPNCATSAQEQPGVDGCASLSCLAVEEKDTKLNVNDLEYSTYVPTTFIVLSAPALGSLVTTTLTAIASPLQYLRVCGQAQKSSLQSESLSQSFTSGTHSKASLPGSSHKDSDITKTGLFFHSIESAAVSSGNDREYARETSSNICAIKIEQLALADSSMHSLVEVPIEITFICSARPRTGQDERRSGEVKLDAYCSSVALQLCRPDLLLLSSIADEISRIAEKIPGSCGIASPGANASSIETSVISNVPSIHRLSPQESEDVELVSVWSSEIDTIRSTRTGAPWTLVWRIAAECDGLQVTLASWPFVMPLSRLRFESLGMQLTRRALTSDGIALNMQVAQVCMFICEPSTNSSGARLASCGDSPSTVDFRSVSAGSGQSHQTRHSPRYVHTDFTTGKSIELSLVPMTETFTIDVAVAFLASPYITLDVAVNCTLRFLVATSFLPGLRLLGFEFEIPALLPGPVKHPSPASSITITVTPVTFCPITFPSWFRPPSSTWFMTQVASPHQTSSRPRSSIASTGSGAWNPTRHHRRGDYDAGNLSNSNTIFRQSTLDSNGMETLNHFPMPISLSEYRRVGMKAERWASNIRCTDNSKRIGEPSVNRCFSNQNSKELLKQEAEDCSTWGSIKIRDLRQIPFFLLSSHRETTRWLRNESCHELIYRIDVGYPQPLSGTLKPGTEVLLRNFSSSSSLLLQVPEFPNANRQFHIHMLRYLPSPSLSERRSQLVIKEDASEGRRLLTIGCPLRVRSTLSRPVEIIFLAEANATSDWQCELTPRHPLHLPLSVSSSCSSLIVKLRSEVGSVWTASVCFRSLGSRCSILTASVSAQRTFVCGLRSLPVDNGRAIELLLFEPIVLHNALPRQVEIAVTQGYPHRETCRKLDPLSSEGLTLFDWNLSLAVRIRIPGIADNTWSGPATAALPPEMIANSHSPEEDIPLFTDNGDRFIEANRTSRKLWEGWNSTGEQQKLEGNTLSGVLSVPTRRARKGSLSPHETSVKAVRRPRMSGYRKSVTPELVDGSDLELDPIDSPVHVLSRTVSCQMPKSPPVDLTVRFEFDGFKLDVTVTCPYWIVNLTSLQLKYIPSVLPASSGTLPSTLDSLNLPPCETFAETHSNKECLGASDCDTSSTTDQGDGESIRPITFFSNINFIFSKYCTSVANRIQAEKSELLLRAIENKIPQLTSQLHDGFRVESDSYGSSTRCDLSTPRSTNSVSASVPTETLERSSLVSLTKASVPLIQQVCRVRNSLCSATLIVFRPTQVVVNHCPFTLKVKRSTSPNDPPVELLPKRLYQPIWTHKKGPRELSLSRLASDWPPGSATPKWSKGINAVEETEGFINVYTEVAQDILGKSAPHQLSVDCLFLRIYISMGTHFIVISAPYTYKRPVYWDTIHRNLSIIQPPYNSRAPPPPYLLRNSLLIPIYVHPLNHSELSLTIPPLTEVPMAPERNVKTPVLRFSVHQAYTFSAEPKNDNRVEESLSGKNGKTDKCSKIAENSPNFYLDHFNEVCLTPLADVLPTTLQTQWAVLNLLLTENSESRMGLTGSRRGDTSPDKKVSNCRHPELEHHSQITKTKSEPSETSIAENGESQLIETSDVVTLSENGHSFRKKDIATSGPKKGDWKQNLAERRQLGLKSTNVDVSTFGQRYLMRYVCRITTSCVGATNIISITGSYILSSLSKFRNLQLNGASNVLSIPMVNETQACYKTANVRENGSASSFCSLEDVAAFPKQDEVGHLPSEIPDIIYRSVLSAFEFPLFPSIQIKPFADGGRPLLSASAIRQIHRQRRGQKPFMPLWLSRLELSFHFRQVTISFVRSISSLETIEARALPSPNGAHQVNSRSSRVNSSIQPSHETTASRVRHFLNRETTAITSLSHSEVRNLGLAPLELVITQLRIWTRPYDKPFGCGGVGDRDTTLSLNPNDVSVPQRRLQVTVLSFDVIGGGFGGYKLEPNIDVSGSGNNVEAEHDSSQDYVVNETPHILRPTRRNLSQELERTSSKDVGYQPITNSRPTLSKLPNEETAGWHPNSSHQHALTSGGETTTNDQCSFLWNDSRVFQMLIDFDFPFSSKPDEHESNVYMVFPKNKNQELSELPFEDSSSAGLYFFDGTYLVRSFLPHPIDDAAKWTFALHLHHLIVVVAPLTIRIDFSWADRCLRPLVQQFKLCGESLFPAKSPVPTDIQKDRIILTKSSMIDAISTVLPRAVLEVPRPTSQSIRLLIETTFLQELRVNLSVFRLMKVLTFNEAEFRWPAVRFDTPRIFTLVDVQKLIHDHFVKQLLKQWFQVVLAFDIVGRPLSRIRKIWNQLLRRLVRASVDFCEPETGGSTFTGWWDIPATPLESFGIQKLAILLIYTLSCHLTRLADRPALAPPPVVAMLRESRRPEPAKDKTPENRHKD